MAINFKDAYQKALANYNQQQTKYNQNYNELANIYNTQRDDYMGKYANYLDLVDAYNQKVKEIYDVSAAYQERVAPEVEAYQKAVKDYQDSFVLNESKYDPATGNWAGGGPYTKMTFDSGSAKGMTLNVGRDPNSATKYNVMNLGLDPATEEALKNVVGKDVKDLDKDKNTDEYIYENWDIPNMVNMEFNTPKTTTTTPATYDEYGNLLSEAITTTTGGGRPKGSIGTDYYIGNQGELYVFPTKPSSKFVGSPETINMKMKLQRLQANLGDAPTFSEVAPTWVQPEEFTLAAPIAPKEAIQTTGANAIPEQSLYQSLFGRGTLDTQSNEAWSLNNIASPFTTSEESAYDVGNMTNINNPFGYVAPEALTTGEGAKDYGMIQSPYL